MFKKAVLVGIDVSHSNGPIAWKSVARAGLAFAYAKATESIGKPDHLFHQNWAGIKDSGLLRGAYHFFHPAEPALAQAEAFLRTVGQLAPGDLPPVLDLEETSTERDEWLNIEPASRMSGIVEWLERVEGALGRRPLIYTRRGFVQDTLGKPGPLLRYPIWIAHYTRAARPAMPAGWDAWTMWQYTDRGRIEGVAGNLDMNRFSGSHADLLRLAGLDIPANTGSAPNTLQTDLRSLQQKPGPASASQRNDSMRSAS